MPRRLLDRCRPDSIREFELAALHRFDDGLALAAAGRRTGAIYLWGYAAEMTLKASYFSLIGLARTATITWIGDLQPAIGRGRGMGIAWPGQGAGHNVRAWAELLIAVRALSIATAYAPPFDTELQRRGQRLEYLWRETLRYRKNYAYEYELVQTREATEWLLVNASFL
ncbi:MAG TPA: hypothetical protein VG125_12790 [Pirellulales bacterium]|jgi:hypothetical protein|nr:hypothetical protein [Pirellulales bacterium]